MKTRLLGFFVGVLAVSLFLEGCAPKQPAMFQDQDKVLAVAPFEQPKQNWELLAGYPSGQEALAGDILQELDLLLMQNLQERGREQFLGPEKVLECKGQITREYERSKLSGLQFWNKVGNCLKADFFLIPHLFQWRERQGKEWGVQAPARVHFDLCLLDIRQQELVDRYKFDQEQQALSQNLLQLRRFFQRGGKWITATQLADEGIEQALQELGL